MSSHDLVFFGDSLTAGHGLPAAASFPALIQQKLDAAGRPYRALNYGVSGETSAGGRQRLPAVLARHPAPVAFVLALGANDGLRGLRVADTSANLRAMLHAVRAAAPAARLVLAGLDFPFASAALPVPLPGLGQYAREFSALFGRLAAEEQVAFVPSLLAGVLGQPALNLPDRVHPNAAGQQVLAANVWAVLGPLLPAAA